MIAYFSAGMRYRDWASRYFALFNFMKRRHARFSCYFLISDHRLPRRREQHRDGYNSGGSLAVADGEDIFDGDRRARRGVCWRFPGHRHSRARGYSHATGIYDDDIFAGTI